MDSLDGLLKCKVPSLLRLLISHLVRCSTCVRVPSAIGSGGWSIHAAQVRGQDSGSSATNLCFVRKERENSPRCERNG